MKTIFKFCLQSLSSKIGSIITPTDMEVEVLRARQYWRWHNKGLSEDLQVDIMVGGKEEGPDIIPVGSVEWVVNYCRGWLGIDSCKALLTPLGIPDCIVNAKDDFLGRRVKEVQGEYIPIFDDDPWGGRDLVEWYCKSKTHIKGQENGWKKTGDSLDQPYGKDEVWQLSEKLGEEIEGEFRVFLDRMGNILDVRNYIGYDVWPDIDKVCDMARILHTHIHRPISFDVIVTSKGDTFFLEAHDYWALGLYGFSHPKSFPYLINDWWRLGKKVGI